MKTSLALGRVCCACGKERKNKVLRYDPETLFAYCDNPYICNMDEHPNSELKLIKRGKSLNLITWEEASEAHKKELLSLYSADMVVRIQDILTKPISLRIQDVDMAKFILQVHDEQKFTSLAEVFRYTIQTLMDSTHKTVPQKHVEELVPEPEPEKVEAKESEWTF